MPSWLNGVILDPNQTWSWLWSSDFYSMEMKRKQQEKSMRSIRQRLKKFYSSRNITWLVRRWLWILIHYDKRNDCLSVCSCVCWKISLIFSQDHSERTRGKWEKSDREREGEREKRKNRLRFQRRFSFFVLLSTYLSLLRKYSSLFSSMQIFINSDWSSFRCC